MDPLTHTATGLLLARCGLNRWTRRAPAILMLAANVPDLDIVTAAGGQLSYLHYHRHLTHSLIGMPVMAALPVLVVGLFGRNAIDWKGAYAASLLAVASHLLLDWTNVYGIRPFLPFSGRWVELGWTNVVDLWIWFALFASIAGPFLGRLVGSEIASGHARKRAHGRGFAIAALAFLLFYNLGRGVLHGRAVETVDSRIYQGENPARVAALPGFVNPWHWRGLVETSTAFEVIEVNLLGDYDPSSALVLHRTEASPAIAAARQTPAFQGLLAFAQWPFWRVTPAPALEEGKQVELYDLRFGTPLTPGFRARAELNRQGQVVESVFTFGQLRPH